MGGGGGVKKGAPRNEKVGVGGPGAGAGVYRFGHLAHDLTTVDNSF